MADELVHGGICAETWWSNSCTSRKMFGSSSLCSSSTISDLGGTFGWSNLDMFDDMKSTATLTRSTDESLFLHHQDVQNFDESLVSTTTSEWKEAFLQTNGTSQGSYPVMLQEDLSSGMNNYNYQQHDAIMEFCPKTYVSDQESSNNTAFKQHMNSDFTSTCEDLPTNYPMNPSSSCGYSSTFLQNLFSDDTSTIQKPLFENHQAAIFATSTASIDDDFLSNNLNGFSLVKQPPLAFSNNVSTTQLQAPSSSLSEEFNHSKATIQANLKEEGANKTNDEPAFKRPRIETPSSLPTFKVRKEKLGDRITAIQQLVSPFGKTDTASVLHEAIEYIKFLHDQVNVLSAPYMKNGPPCQRQQLGTKEEEQDLKSRGLCLVPLSSTFSLAAEPPTDFWAPTLGGAFRNDKFEAWNGGSHIALACKY